MSKRFKGSLGLGLVVILGLGVGCGRGSTTPVQCFTGGLAVPGFDEGTDPAKAEGLAGVHLPRPNDLLANDGIITKVFYIPPDGGHVPTFRVQIVYSSGLVVSMYKDPARARAFTAHATSALTREPGSQVLMINGQSALLEPTKFLLPDPKTGRLTGGCGGNWASHALIMEREGLNTTIWGNDNFSVFDLLRVAGTVQ